MRKLILFISVLVVLVAGGIFYLNEEKKHFIDDLPQSPVAVNQSINKSSSSVNETEDSNNFFEGQVVEVDGERFIPHETLQQEQNASAEKTASETPTPDEEADEKADFVRDQWLQMFGDIPQVHAASEYMRKIYKQERHIPIDEVIAGLEASHYLFPNGGHGILLKMRKSQKAQGIDVVEFVYEEIENERYAPDYKEIVLNAPEPFPSDASVPDSIASGSIDEDIDVLPARSEGTPVIPKSKTSVMSEHVHHEDGHAHETQTIKTPAPAAAKGVEADGWVGLSSEQRERAKRLFDEYGTTEGLRRLKESDPEAARRFESDPDSIEDAENRHKLRSRRVGTGRERHPVLSRDVPDGRQSESESKD